MSRSYNKGKIALSKTPIDSFFIVWIWLVLNQIDSNKCIICLVSSSSIEFMMPSLLAKGEDPQFFSLEKHPELSSLASKDENANKITLFQLGTEHTGTKCITFNV